MARIANFLGAPSDPGKLAFAVEQSTGARMRELEEKQAHVFSSTRETRPDLPYIRKAKAGGWRTDLPRDCVAKIESAWGSLMKDMGYELTVSNPAEAPAAYAL